MSVSLYFSYETSQTCDVVQAAQDELCAATGANANVFCTPYTYQTTDYSFIPYTVYNFEL